MKVSRRCDVTYVLRRLLFKMLAVVEWGNTFLSSVICDDDKSRYQLNWRHTVLSRALLWSNGRVVNVRRIRQHDPLCLVVELLPLHVKKFRVDLADFFQTLMCFDDRSRVTVTVSATRNAWMQLAPMDCYCSCWTKTRQEFTRCRLIMTVIAASGSRSCAMFAVYF